ncbi:MAG TPA: hypothetical protein VM819_12935 [Vicinamibacterales bacterium]|nr:hypothetical protein [Vicinamibacterales bacterium]
MRGETAKSSVRVLFAVMLAAALAATASAQSLGDLAKKEAERRKAIKSSGKVLTGDSIRSVPAPSTPAPSPAPAAPGAAAGSAATEKPKPEVDRKAQELAWRQRIQGARDSLQRSQMFAEALQSRINGLTADFTARDDPAQRAVVANDRQKALAELDRVKNDIVQQTKAIADIQEEARRAGIPPGWLR